MALENRLDAFNAANRRGLLLGLTLSEIMMIILFVLLLLLGAVFLEQDEEQRRLAELERAAQAGEVAAAAAEGMRQQIFQLEKAAEAGETALAVVEPMQDLLKQLGVAQNEIDDILREMKTIVRLKQEIRKLGDEATALARTDTPEDRKRLAALSRQIAEKRTELAKAERRIDAQRQELAKTAAKQREAGRLAGTLAEMGVTPEQARELERTLEGTKQVLDDLRQRAAKAGGNPAAVEATLREAMSRWADVAMDNRNLAEQGRYWKTRWEQEAGQGKTGVTPCWATEGTVDFIYDVALTDDGFLVRRNDTPQWAEDYSRLPTSGFRFLSLMSHSEFVAAARPLFEYSVKKDCRFFVRIFDQTGPTAKVVYQQRRRAVEGYFYISDMKNARF